METSMAYNFNSFDTRVQETQEWLSKEFSAVRTGRATPALLDSIQIESYGARVPLQQASSITVEDARTLRITPWDKGSLKSIEKAITDANYGVSVVTDDKGVRVIFPELTSERRTQLMKVAKAKLEDARVSLRKARDETLKDVEQQVKANELTEDDKFRVKEELQKRIDAANSALNGMLEKKELEINQ